MKKRHQIVTKIQIARRQRIEGRNGMEQNRMEKTGRKNATRKPAPYLPTMYWSFAISDK